MLFPDNWTDIRLNFWVNRRLPLWLRPYAVLMRLDRPIGTWLLLLPCWWSIALASPKFPHLGLMFLFALGAVVMRGAGCVVNDMYDRDLDRQVERTQTRPLASGEVKLWQAFVLLAVLLAIGLGILLLLNRLTIVVGALSLLLVFSYPLMKRITWWPQLFLGLTFNWGALMGWSAVTGGIATPALLLYGAGIFWTLAYDTIYACQDLRDDAMIGVKSTARLFGDNIVPMVALFYVLAFLMLIFAAWDDGLGEGFVVLLLVAACYMAGQLILWRRRDPANCLKRFRSNRDFGWIVRAAILLGKFF